MGRIPDELVDKIIHESDIVEVISEYVSLKSSGKNFMGVCPFHSDKGPSLSVSREKQLYHCFGCGASGNVLGFIMRIKNIEFIDALRFLGEKIGVSIEQKKEHTENPRFKLKDEMYRINIEAARYFFRNIYNVKAAYNYFLSRNMEDKTIKKFGLGYSLDSWNSLESYLAKKGFSKDIMLKAGLIIKGKNATYDRFRNRVMFPVFDYRGRVIGFGGRVLDDTKPKYLNSPETDIFLKGTNLYGLNFAIKNKVPDSIIIVEGYMDCISLHQAGITNVVASLGTALTESQAKLIKKYTENVYVCYDSDSAGKTATLKGMDILQNVGCNVKVISVPVGKDPDEFIKLNGVDSFNNLINNALPIIDYKIHLAREKYDLKNMEDSLKFTKRVAYILSSLNSEIEIQYYGKKIAEETGIPQSSIIEDIKKLKRKNNYYAKNNEEEKENNVSNYKIEPAFKKSEQMLLTLCLKSKDYFEYIKGRISVGEFITPFYKIAADFLYKRLENEEKIIPNSLLGNFSTSYEISEVSLIFNKVVPNDISTDLIDDYIKVIKKHNIEDKIKSIKIQIKKYEKNGEKQKSLELFNKLILLQRQLDTL
ncbi:DNA primase [Clostridium cylindrosporum]|uniref:DNA primase n=1 Tax=Clostridium cylindrosporum DSM 605 TaxID=1121307 RepID=A0A0J8DBH2_CLOCY|nr:DNA primase [Clostridium cylindrosporum]KMT21664.1 DNA primase DnaG [Clostridium cylindrosporum DSM 605]